jgi:lysophospholipase L1-like esterase
MSDAPRIVRNVARPAKLAIALAALALLGACVQAGVRFNRSVALAKTSEPYQHRPLRPDARILIVGDSTAVGTGAMDPRASIAGRIAQEFPDTEIVNLGADGARLADVHGQLESIGSTRFDLILVQAGGNDVIRLASASTLADDWSAVARAAAGRAPQVIIMPAGNVGTAPFFFPPVSWVMTARARSAREIAAGTAQASGAAFVDLFYERQDDPFLQDPERFYAPDFLHPSDAGYGLWYDALKTQGDLSIKLGPRSAASVR